ncbi:MAG TPA: hypothetical protein VFH67_04615 [bacterium]|nr:hypothetical protein [bacterium]
MSVRAIAVQDRKRHRMRVVARPLDPPRVIRRRHRWVNTAEIEQVRGFRDDERLVRLKLIMLGGIVFLAALLETPF